MINRVEDDDDDRYNRVGTLLDPSTTGPSSSLGARHPLHDPSSSNPLGLGYAASSTAHVEAGVDDDDASPPWTSTPPPAQFFMVAGEEEEGSKTTAADLNLYSSFAKDKRQMRLAESERERWKVPSAVPGGPRSRAVGRQGGSQQQTGRRVIEEWV